jgi:predicted Zn-dependent peptidase
VDLLAGAGPGLMSEILGGSATSRLFKRVREEASLAYGCGAVCLPDSATLLVQAGIPPGSAARVEQLVQQELDRMAAEPVGDDEFEQARAGLRRRLRASLDRPMARLGFRLRGLVTGRATRIETALEELQRTTPEDIRALADGCRLDSVFLLENVES